MCVCVCVCERERERERERIEIDRESTPWVGRYVGSSSVALAGSAAASVPLAPGCAFMIESNLALSIFADFVLFNCEVSSSPLLEETPRLLSIPALSW